MSDLTGDIYITCGSYYAAVVISTFNSIQPESILPFFYQFVHHSVASQISILNATHTAELPYIFQNNILQTQFSPAELLLSTEMVQYWQNFHYGGNPNSGKNQMPVNWLPFELLSMWSGMVWETPSYLSTFGSEPHHCEFWYPFLMNGF